jgi:hypothetical protein
MLGGECRSQKPEFRSAQARLRFGTTRHVASGESGDLSPQSKDERMRMDFSETNWVQIGLKWVRFHFLKKSKLVKSSMFIGGFAFFELGSFSRFHF